MRGVGGISGSASCRPPRRGLEKNDMIAEEGARVVVRMFEMAELCDFKEDIVNKSLHLSKGNIINSLWMVPSDQRAAKFF